MVVGNKRDLVEARQVPRDAALRWCEEQTGDRAPPRPARGTHACPTPLSCLADAALASVWYHTYPPPQVFSRT